MYNIRRYRDADAASIVALFRDTVRRVNSRDYGKEQILAWAPDEIDLERWRASLSANYTLVAEEGGPDGGQGIMGAVAGQQIVGFTDLAAGGYVDRFYVHADRQGRGVGAALMASLLEEARRQGLSSLHADVSITARPFFQRQGFVVVREQVVLRRGQEFVNFRMERLLEGGAIARPNIVSRGRGG